jgi:non-homologous end joining protein Ku
MAVRVKVTLKLAEVVSTLIDVEAAVSTPESLHTVCTDGHDPIRVRQSVACPTCKAADRHGFFSARELPDGTLVLVPPDAVTPVAAELKEQIALSVHRADDVTLLAAGNVYHLKARSNTDTAYALIAQLVARRPDLAFLAQWAPRSNVSLYRLGVARGVLTLTALARPEQMRAAPAAPSLPAASPLLAAVEAFADAACIPFAEADYIDARKAALDAALAAVTPVAAGAAPDTSGPDATVTSLLDRLTAAVTERAAAEQVAAAPKPRAARKPRARKTPVSA